MEFEVSHSVFATRLAKEALISLFWLKLFPTVLQTSKHIANLETYEKIGDQPNAEINEPSVNTALNGTDLNAENLSCFSKRVGRRPSRAAFSHFCSRSGRKSAMEEPEAHLGGLLGTGIHTDDAQPPPAFTRHGKCYGSQAAGPLMWAAGHQGSVPPSCPSRFGSREPTGPTRCLCFYPRNGSKA